MQTQVKATDAANKGAANSEEALAKKVDALGKASASAKTKVETMQKIVEKQKKAQQDAAKALEEAKQKYGENSAEVNKAQQAYNNITTSVNKWETELGKAKIQESEINGELQKNKGYLEEAQKSADKTAQSIDEYGKEVKDSDEETGDFNQTLAKTGAAEAMQKVCDVLANTIGKVGEKALEAAKELDTGYDTIIKKTGASGQALDDFKGIANDIFGDMPEDMEEVGKAVGEVNTRFGQSGEVLKKTSTQFLRFASINETDVSDAVDDAQNALAAFNMDARDADKYLDVLTRTGQKTGANVADLSKKVTENATAFQEMGLDIYQSVDFMGQLETAGADSASVMSGLKRALKNATEEGKPLNEALAEMQTAIVNGTGSVDGLTYAYDLFGKSGAGIFQAVKNGQIDFNNLADSTSILEDATGSLNTAYENTLDGWDKMTVAQNNLKIAGSELTEKFFEAAAPAIDGLTGILKGALDVFESLPPEVQNVIGVIGGVGTMAAQVIPQIVNFYTQLMTLTVMKKLAGDAGGLSGGLGKLKGGFAKLKSGAETAASVIAGVAAGLAMVDEAAKQLTTNIDDFTGKVNATKAAYESTSDSVADLKETINTYTTTQEKRAAIEAKIAEVEETQRQARRQLTNEIDSNRMATIGYSEAMGGELDTMGSILNAMTMGAVRGAALEDAVLGLDKAQRDNNITLEGSSEDLDTLNAMLAEVEAEEKAAAETVVSAEGEIVAAKDASISKVGEELAAWQNLSSEQQTIASDIAAAVGAMKDSIAGAVQSIGDFFTEVKTKEEVSAQDMYANFQAQIAAMTEWEQNLVALADAGINQGLLQYLADMGPAASNYVAAMKQGILDGTGATVDEWNAIYQEKLDLEGATNTEGQALLTAIGGLAAGGSEKFAEIAGALNTAAKEDGTYIVDGMVAGINEAKAQAEEAAQTLGEDTVKAAAKGAQTKSPSRATLDTGKNVDLGMINGIRALQAQVAQAGKMMATGVINSIKASNVPNRATAEGQKIGQGLARGMSSQSSAAAAAAKTLAASVAQALRAQAQINYNAAVYVLQQVAKGITSGAASAKTTGSNAGQTIASSIANGINANAVTATSAASSMASSVSSSAGSISTASAYSAGYALAQGIASGIAAGQSLAINAAAQMAANALQAAKNRLSIKSPSKVFRDEVGAMAAKGLAEGFNSELDIQTKGMVGAFSKGLPDISQYPAVTPNVYVYLGDRELTTVMTQGVVKHISGGVRAYGAAGGRR